MTAHQIFRLRNPVLLMALAAAFPLLSYAATAANVDFTAGSVTAVNAAGVQRPLTKGAEIGNGDTIRTGTGGRAQVRFSDGAMVSLQPETEFRIDNYQYSGQVDGQEKGFFSLIKGGLRTITGLVGRSNRDNYKVTTSVATIGIRGTEYNAIFDAISNALAVAAGDGLVEVCNGAGCVQLGAGEAGRVISGSAPQRTDTKPQLPPTAAGVPASVQPVFASSNQGLPVGVLTGANTYSTVYSLIDFCCAGLNQSGQAVGPGTITSATLTEFTTPGGLAGANLGEPGNYAISFGNDGIVAWGTWATAVGGFSGSLAGGEGGYQGILQYVVGLPTIAPDGVALGGSSGTYTLLGAPPAISTEDGVGAVTSATMAVVFSADPKVTSLNIGVGFLPVANVYTRTYGLSASNIDITDFTTGARFAGSASVSGTGGACGGSGCSSANVNGAFFGAGAPRAGVSFKFSDTGLPATVSGAVALKK